TPAGLPVWGPRLGLMPRAILPSLTVGLLTRNASLRSRPQTHYVRRNCRTVGADAITAIALRSIERRVGHLHQLNRVTSVIRIRRDADADRDVMSSRR